MPATPSLSLSRYLELYKILKSVNIHNIGLKIRLLELFLQQVVIKVNCRTMFLRLYWV